MYLAIICLYLAASVLGQRPGNVIAENAVSMPMQTCTKGGCTLENTKVVLDANWRWIHTNSGYTNCYNGNQWDPKYCPDGKKCVQNCVLEGADYQKTYGISSPSSGSLKLNFVTNTPNGKTVGSRVYLLAPNNNYRTFNLLNREFSFDVDVSNLPCGLNGALYFSQMDADGGMSKHSGNKAGAKYGTGYCDAQCPQDIKFINGEANVNNWNRNSGFGNYGSCCPEMDIWEANSDSTAYTPHPCRTLGQSRCSGNSQCGAGNSRYNNVCDRDGCDFNPYRLGNQNFFGPGKQVDTRRPFTVVTQFVTSNGQDNGQLKEIRRLYVQNGKVVQNVKTNIKGVSATNVISDAYCKNVKSAFGDRNYFGEVGGMGRMGQALKSMVLVLSVWDDHVAGMKWLDSRYPDNGLPSKAGVMRGRCSPSSGDPNTLESQSPGSSVTYSNIKFGTMGSTYKS